MRKIIILMTLALVFAILAAGCNIGVKQPVDAPNQGKDQSNSERQNDVPGPGEVVLYFSDTQAMFLVPEKRAIIWSANQEELVRKMLEELIKGPTRKDLAPTMPPGVKINSVALQNGLATVDFSKELQTNHWGGSAGEMMTIYSIVNTLTELPELTQVQILIDKEKVDTIAGHLDVSQPLIRDNTIIAK